eukprot:1853318-Rhodomonas_salina.1
MLRDALYYVGTEVARRVVPGDGQPYNDYDAMYCLPYRPTPSFAMRSPVLISSIAYTVPIPSPVLIYGVLLLKSGPVILYSATELRY